ncbi:MAG: S26 family signal peptidase [Flavobacteriales bacterium]|jgi:signal peptidase I|nr:S26 family signal peptidase [Flavobacteriales bacterium]
MEIAQILIYLMVVLHFASLWKIFEKAGRPTWEGFVPVYNYIIWLKVVNKPWWWIFFFIIPFVNIVVTVALHVETIRLFGRYEPKDTILAIVLPWYYIPALAYDKTATIEAPTDWSKKKDVERRTLHDHITLFFMAPFIGHIILITFKLLGSKDKPNKPTMPAEWTNALGFAIVAATIIRTFTFEAFTIPTGSMEKTMLIGDYLFVNKLKYGPRIPETPLSVPFVHNRIPGTFTKSYVEWLKNDYTRLPGYGEITRGDIMVFNWPVGDTVLLNETVIAHDYYAFVRNGAFQRSGLNIEQFEKVKEKAFAQERKRLAEGGGVADMGVMKTKGIQTLTNDKKENYIKRCVGVAGDSLSIIDGVIHINGKPQDWPEFAQYSYRFDFKNSTTFNPDYLVEEFDIYRKDFQYNMGVDRMTNKGVAMFTCTPAIAEKLKSYPDVATVSKMIHPRGFDFANNNGRKEYFPIYPHHPAFDWTRDNFGPLYIPKKGSTIELNAKNYILYKRAIQAYENHKIEQRKDGFYIDDEKATTYTFESDYYWLMGDNRHGSVDSRYWGLVPDTHVVGTASFVWMSRHPEKPISAGGIRWNRIFSFVK